MRGEYRSESVLGHLRLELPPRARRILCPATTQFFVVGTTSACAENTQYISEHLHGTRNYLRVRGEYSILVPADTNSLELPPRARRIPFRDPRIRVRHGTTSACAENTSAETITAIFSWNYLRVRGEYWAAWRTLSTNSELPPRARRIHQQTRSTPTPPGTTSACAENTGDGSPDGSTDGNYLRVRGEYRRRGLWGRW